MSGDLLAFEGVVAALHRGDLYSIKIEVGGTTREVLCTPSGKLRARHVHMVLGDRVSIEVSPYDVSRGRVVQRHDNDRK